MKALARISVLKKESRRKETHLFEFIESSFSPLVGGG